MSPRHSIHRLIVAGLGLLPAALFAAEVAPKTLRFDFGSGPVAAGYTSVSGKTLYTVELGYGFEPDATITDVSRESADALRGDFCTSDAPFYFSCAVPEGNYRVTVTLGDAAGMSDTTVKAELRRLMLESVRTAKGEFVTRSFIVNARQPKIAGGGEVRLKAPRENTQEAWAWDERITLEFNGFRPCVCAVEVTPVEVPTIFLIGDSTVCDQSREPFNSWGQMLPRFFKPEIAIANHGESGETYRDSIGRRRLDKMLSVMKPGDYLFMQFGHNDQKQIAAGTGGPFTTYKAELKTHVEAARARGGIPVVVSPMERRNFDDAGKIKPSLTDYAEAARQSAKELGVAFIDLNAMSIPFYEFLEAKGRDYSRKAFAGQDNTHHCNYGSYELAKCIVEGIKANKPEIAKFIQDDYAAFDPAHPDAVETFDVPQSSLVTNQKPLGN